MKAARHDPAYWSSCCGRLIEYIGYYRCTGCQARAVFGGVATVTEIEAARIRKELAAMKAAREEAVADGRLF